MGILTESIKALFGGAQSVTTTAPIGTAGVPQIQQWSYERGAREGYGLNELVYACIEARATSAAEPTLCAYRGDTKIDGHPLLDIWNNPNPYCDRFTLTATIVMHLDIGGNAYIEKVRSGAGKIVELWTPRPDRVFVVPNADGRVAGYAWRAGTAEAFLPPEDVVHVKTRHPLDDYYGLPPLAVLAGRVDLDNWARDFVRSFFTNAGVPAGLLTVKQKLDQQEHERIKRRFREGYGGPAGWNGLMVLSGGEADYKQMGLPLGESGAGLESLDAQTEARVCMAFGIPPAILSTRLGMNASSYANQVAQMRMFWTQTLIPLYKMLGAALTRGFCRRQPDGRPAEFPDIDRLEFDLDDVAALAEDQDQLSARILDQMQKGAISWEEARVALGHPERPEGTQHTFLIPATVVPTPLADILEPAAALPEPTPQDQAAADQGGDYAPAPAPTMNGRNGRH